MYKKQNQYDFTFEAYNSIQDKLGNEFQENLKKKKVFLAFDGYIDSLYSVIKTRTSLDRYTKFETIDELANRLYEIKGSSGNLELKLKKITSGGFVPNNGKALSSLNVNVSLLGALGYPEINEIFKSLIQKDNVDSYSFCNSAKTIGLEFNDGKVMLSDLENLSQINWELLMERIGSEIIIDKLENSNAIGFGYWALNPELSNIWKNLMIDIFPSIRNLDKKFFFVDLGDLKKRNKSDVLEMLDILKNIEDYIPVILSLNDQEATDISKIQKNTKSINPNAKNFEDFVEGGKLINNELNLSYLIIHSPYFATISSKNDQHHYWITEGYTSKPKYTVSAGDHFLSGFIAGFLCDLNLSESLIMANALTAIFVRTGFSPKFDQLREFVRRYIDYIIQDNPIFP